MICGTLTLRYLFRIVLSDAVAKGEDFITSGSVTRQGGYTKVGSRTDVNIAFPVSFSHVLGIAGLAVVNSQNPAGRGLEHIKTFSGSSFRYYSGYDIADKRLTWLAVGI